MTADRMAEWMERVALAGSDTELQAAVSDPEFRRRETVERLHAGVLEVLFGDGVRAARFAGAAALMAVSLDDLAKSLAQRAIGHVRFAQARHEEAVAAYESALALLPDPDGREAGRTLLSGMQPLIYLSRYEQAEDWAKRATAIFERLHDDLRLARVALNLGNVYYRQDRPAEALEQYRIAHETLAAQGEPRDIAAVLSNIAVCSVSLGEFESAERHYEQARDYSAEHNLPLLVAQADYNIAYLHFLRGDYLRAIEMYRESRERCRLAGDEYHLALCDLDESEMYLELNLTSDAVRLACDAAARFDRLGMRYEQAKALLNQAVALARRDPPSAAFRFFRHSHALFLGENNPVCAALVRFYEAVARFRQGRVLSALRLIRAARRVLDQSQLTGKAAQCRLLEASILIEQDRIAEARSLVDAVLEAPGETPLPVRFQGQLLLARIEEKIGDAGVAAEVYESARRNLESLRGGLRREDLRISYVGDKLAVYEGLVLLNLRDSIDVAAAAGYVQQAKSRSLTDLLVVPDASSTESPGEIVEMRRDLNAKYRQVELAAMQGRAGWGRSVEALLRQARESEDRLLQRVADLPDAAREALLESGPAPLPLDRIQAGITESAAVVEYYQARGRLYAFVIRRDGVSFVALGEAAPVRKAVHLLQFQMSKFGFGDDYVSRYRVAIEAATAGYLSWLYDELVRPLQPELAGARHLIIGPHGFLHHLPFHALYGGRRHLLDEYTISYTPSAQAYALTEARPRSAGVGSLILGAPDAAAPLIEDEVRAAAASLPSPRLLIGPDATEEQLQHYAPSSRFVHIAAHGIFRRDNPMFSSLRLGDSHISLFDLYRLAMPAELVTLSGCSTGMSVVVGADELIGLMRGLFRGGARSVLVSLWNVHDRSATHFMEHFYRGLGGGLSRASAIQSAMQQIRAQAPHPYYWAPWTLLGNFGPVTYGQ